MALQTTSPPTTPSPQVVANAFVEQYYHILHHSPELVYRFYQDSSVLSRPDSDGEMTSVTTMQGINEKILSLDYKNCKAEIKTADAQKSHNDGITLLVTGCLMGRDNVRRKFAQSFFLAPQDNGYFVLNDVFRYLEDDDPLEKFPVNGVVNADRFSSILEPDAHPVPEPPASDIVILMQEDKNVVDKTTDVVSREIQIADKKEFIVEPQTENAVSRVAESASSSFAQKDAPKKSYASIVKVAKGGPRPTKIYVPANITKATPKETESQPVGSTASSPAPEALAEKSVDGPEEGNYHEEAEGYSIYVRNLPFNTTVSQLEEEFKKFGLIKEEGVQVRHNRQQGYCFGFVEFLSASSMNNAIKASPIIICGRKAVVEAKRTTNRAVGERDRFSSSRGGYRNGSFRGRVNYGGGRGYGRIEYTNQTGEPSGRDRGSSGRWENYQPSGWRGRGSGGRKQNFGRNY